MKRFPYLAIHLVAFLHLSIGCNTGLAPLNEPSGFRGVIHFKNWPRADSVQNLQVVAFEAYPRDSSSILATLIAGRGAAFPGLNARLPRFVDSVAFEFTTNNGIGLQVTNYEYVIVAQQYGPNVLTDWQPAGVYTARPNSFEPAPLRILLHRIVPNVDIDVDFRNPPPKPWR
jgi:hypothetical protein